MVETNKNNRLFTAVCVAGYCSSRNEILELCLPPKLFADENKVTNIKNISNFEVYYYKHNIQMSLLSLCVCCVVFRVSVQSGTSKLSTVASQTVLFAASDTSPEPGEFVTSFRLFHIFTDSARN